MEMEFMVYNLVFVMKMTVYTITRVTQGARQRHFILWLGFRVDVVNLKHSVRYESLVVSNSRNQTSPKPIIYVDIWIYNFTHRESNYSSRTIYSQPGISALPRITANN